MHQSKECLNSDWKIPVSERLLKRRTQTVHGQCQSCNGRARRVLDRFHPNKCLKDRKQTQLWCDIRLKQLSKISTTITHPCRSYNLNPDLTIGSPAHKQLSWQLQYNTVEPLRVLRTAERESWSVYNLFFLSWRNYEHQIAIRQNYANSNLFQKCLHG